MLLRLVSQFHHQLCCLEIVPVGIGDDGIRVKKHASNSPEVDEVKTTSMHPLRILAVLDKHPRINWHLSRLNRGQVSANHAGARIHVGH